MTEQELADKVREKVNELEQLFQAMEKLGFACWLWQEPRLGIPKRPFAVTIQKVITL